jgi:hypothetical protein
MFKMKFRIILSSMQIKEKDRGKNFIEILSSCLSLEHLGYGVLFDVKKRELDL